MKYLHTNLIARDWKKLAQFYMDVFGCEPLYPERDLSGGWIDDLTGITGTVIRGIHLRLPGYGDGGPTLEIFEYNRTDGSIVDKKINQPGFAHVAFHVSDVEEMIRRITEHGGSLYGKTIDHHIENLGVITAVYACDPEKNIIELQTLKEP